MSGSFWGKMGGKKTGKDFDISASKKAVEQSNEVPDDFDEWKFFWYSYKVWYCWWFRNPAITSWAR